MKNLDELYPIIEKFRENLKTLIEQYIADVSKEQDNTMTLTQMDPVVVALAERMAMLAVAAEIKQHSLEKLSKEVVEEVYKNNKDFKKAPKISLPKSFN